MRTKQWALLVAMVFCLHGLKGQIIEYTYSVYFGANVSLNFKLGKNAFRQNFPGVRTFVGFNASNELELSKNIRGSLNFGTCIGLYNKSLGNSLNLDFQDNQIDWTSNITMGALWGDKTDLRMLQTINNLPFYNLQHKGEYAIHVGTNFIMNSYGRHQTNGSFSLTTNRFSFTYYNDGGPFFNLGFGDSFDRYWTGGLMFYWHDALELSEESDSDSTNYAFNRLEFTFDQFTGYQPQMYEITSIFGSDIQDYDLYQQFDPKDLSLQYTVKPNGGRGFDYNSSQYKINYNFDPFVGGSLGVIGSLRDLKREKYFAVQDIIHILTQVPIHPNKDANRLTLGFNYNNRLWQTRSQ